MTKKEEEEKSDQPTRVKQPRKESKFPVYVLALLVAILATNAWGLYWQYTIAKENHEWQKEDNEWKKDDHAWKKALNDAYLGKHQSKDFTETDL